ncbi:hypothetical protein [Pleurocapsa sp. FMAR1]|uniref:hypothetical protein n=1 Tax=Pleurocapsa sp. FMAR1 TaxID=3040204 RepID=UPI0029C6103A|nr:hypothetical protein [Pleurocapsa sp. FMAR1]
MNKTIELPSGKIIDLNRFVALVPDEKTENEQYYLILEGYDKAIALDSQEARSVKEHLKVKSKQNSNGTWDREEQLRKNQPAIELLKKRIERIKKEPPSPEKEAAFERFKKNIDAERSPGRKLYEK